jgi:hypothetical protein
MHWQNETVCIIASGNSLTDSDIESARRFKTIVINDTWQRATWADVLYACDLKWWRLHNEKITFQGKKYTQDSVAAKRYGLELVKGENNKGLGKGLIHFGGSGGYQAINLAYLWGAKRILLLGFDCQKVNNKNHWFGQHPIGFSQSQPFNIWLNNFPRLADDLKAEGVEVINCSPNSALQCFNKKRINEII